MNKRILVVGSTCINFMMNVESIPLAGKTLIEKSGAYSYEPGGKGGNVAITAAQLGAGSVLCSKLGNDTYGFNLEKIYKSYHIDTRFTGPDKIKKTGMSIVISEANNSCRKIVYPGATENLTPSDVEDAFMCYPDAVYVNLDVPYNTAITAINLAEEQLIPVFVYMDSMHTDFPLEYLKELEVFMIDEKEVYFYTGIKPDNMENYLRAAIKLSSIIGAKYYVIRLSKRGAFIYDGKYYMFAPYIETTYEILPDAADFFGAAVVCEYLRNNDINHACMYANAFVALTSKNSALSETVPTHAEVMAYVEKNGFEI